MSKIGVILLSAVVTMAATAALKRFVPSVGRFL